MVEPNKNVSKSSTSGTTKSQTYSSSTATPTKSRPSETIPSFGEWSWSIFIIILTLAALTRFYKVQEPDHVCWVS